jgi:DNA-binding transcriptional ArsR family regulator
MPTKQQAAKAARAERDEQAAAISDELMTKRRKAAGDVTRQRALRLLDDGQERTAKELAEQLGVGVNGLYYHLRVLEDAEFITAGAGRDSGSGMERTYRKGDKWLVTHVLNEDLIHVYHAILETAKHECEQTIYRQIEAVQRGEEPPYSTINSPGFRTTPDEIREFAAQMWALWTEFSERATHLQELADDQDQPLSELYCAYAIVERAATKTQG